MDRSSLDAPATVLALLMGLLVLAVALPFTIGAFPDTPKSYDAIWGGRVADQDTLTVPAETGSYSARVNASMVQPANIVVAVGSCEDTYAPSAQYGQKAATVSYKLSGTVNGTQATLKEGSFTCATKDAGSFTIPLGPHADVARAEAKNEDIARRIVWLDAAGMNRTVEYTLTLTPSRAAASNPGGLPIGLPAPPATHLAVAVTLTLEAWDAALDLHNKEVLR